MPQRPYTQIPVPPIGGPLWGGPGGLQHFIVPCSSITIVSAGATTIYLYAPGLSLLWDTLVSQQIFSAIADAGAVGAISIDTGIGTTGPLPAYINGAQASGSQIAKGNFYMVAFNPALGTQGGYHLLNWDQLGGSPFGAVQFVTAAGPVVVAAGTGDLVINKGAPSATPLTFPAAADQHGVPLSVADIVGNAGDITITPAAGETIMGAASWVLGSSVDGKAATTFKPITGAVKGWILE